MATKPKQQFKPSMSAEAKFSRALKKVGRHAGHIVEAHVEYDKLHDEQGMQSALAAYSRLIEPWAKRQAVKMLEMVSKSNRRAYTNKSKLMGKLIQSQVAEREVGQVARALMEEQVALIKSIPLKAGYRAQKLAMEAAFNGTRADDVAKELMRSTKVSESSAQLIAVTEVARANASITQARAQGAGAPGYIWRTTMDGAERESHAKMNGKYVAYDKEPTLIDGTKGHAGTFPRCRCFQDVQFDDT